MSEEPPEDGDDIFGGLGSHVAERRGFIRRHRGFFIALAAIVVVLVAIVGGFAWTLNHSIDKVQRIPVKLDPAERPDTGAPKDLNILLLGADAGTQRNGTSSSIIKDAAAATWPAGKNRSDATMILHIDADRKHAYVVSIPRDSYVPVYDASGQKRDSQKINAALSLYGPSGAISTVEHFTGLRIDHLAMVDWDGFEDITNALGGVRVYVPNQGYVDMNGAKALTYVRERHHLPNGDFDRVKRQQNFIRALLSKSISKGTLSNPIKLTKTANAVASHLAVDDGWSTGDIRSLAWSMRSIRTDDITFMTIPITGTRTDPTAGSIDVVNADGCAALFDAMKNDTMPDFVNGPYADLLGSPTQVH